MKSRMLNYSCVAAIFLALAIPIRLVAQADREDRRSHHKYKLIDLGTFGGPNSIVPDGVPPFTPILNDQGTAVGAADTSIPDPYSPNCLLYCFVGHAFEWKQGVLSDLGTLPGLNNSSVSLSLNQRGWIIGGSENGLIDPLTGFPEVNAVLWRKGKIIDLGTLGGNASLANAVNNRGQVVGGALNNIPDSFAAYFTSLYFLFPGATQIHAFLWENGSMKDLGTLGGTDSEALYVNQQGQVAGAAFTNSTPSKITGIPTLDPFLWVPCGLDRRDGDDCPDTPKSTVGKNGRMRDLGTLGGTVGFPTGLNKHGQVSGQSNLAGDDTHHPFLWDRGVLMDLGTLGGNNAEAWWLNDAGEVVGLADLPGTGIQLHHAFVWKHGEMADLGTLGEDACSIAFGINSKHQVVGASAATMSGQCLEYGRAFLSEDRASMIDLNSLISGSSDLTLTVAVFINDRGEISGGGVLPDGDTHGFLLIPCDSDHPGLEGCDYDPVDLDALAASAPANSPSSPSAVNVPKPGSKFAHSVHK